MKTTLEMALEYLEASDNYLGSLDHSEPIAAIKQALAAIPPECATEAEQTAYAFGWNKALEQQRLAPAQEPIGYLCENATGHRYFRWKKPPSVYNPIALYAKP